MLSDHQLFILEVAQDLLPHFKILVEDDTHGAVSLCLDCVNEVWEKNFGAELTEAQTEVLVDNCILLVPHLVTHRPIIFSFCIVVEALITLNQRN